MNRPITQRPAALLAACIALATALTLGVNPTSGAADSPAKGAERFTRVGAPTTVHESVRPGSTAAAPSGHANCGTCSTITTARASTTAKGGEVLRHRGIPTTQVSTHGCGGCSTTLGVTGAGKARTQTVSHGCSYQTMASVTCCR